MSGVKPNGGRGVQGNQWQGYKSRWEGCSSCLDRVVRFEHLPVHPPLGSVGGLFKHPAWVLLLLMLQERERTGEQETLLHTRCWALADQVGVGDGASLLTHNTSWARKASSAHKPGWKQIFRSPNTRGTWFRVKNSKSRRWSGFWLVPPCFKSSSVFNLSAGAAEGWKRRQCKPPLLDFYTCRSEMCTGCPTALRMRGSTVPRSISTGFKLQWNIDSKHFTASVFSLQLNLLLIHR